VSDTVLSFLKFGFGRVSGDDIDLLFGVANLPIFAGAMQVKMGPLHKTKTALIEEKRWWVYSE